MTRWLEAARKAGWHGAKGGEEIPAYTADGQFQPWGHPTKPDKTPALRTSGETSPAVADRFRRVLSGVGETVQPAPGVLSGFVGVSEGAEPAKANAPEADPETLLAWLTVHGPSTYGAAAVALGWGATRAWQAEARLRASGRVQIDDMGRTRAKGGKHE